jgi:hypothetical protein
MDWGGIFAGALAGFLLSLLLWWLQYRVLVPVLQFSEDLSKLTDADGAVYRFKVLNASRRRGVIDLTFNVRLHLGKGVVGYAEADLTKTTSYIRIYTAIDGVIRLSPGVSRIVRFDLRPDRWIDTSPRLLAAAGIDPEGTQEVTLESLLSATPEAYLQVRVLAYDEVSGSRKYFASPKFRAGDIKLGPYNGLKVDGSQPRPTGDGP